MAGKNGGSGATGVERRNESFLHRSSIVSSDFRVKKTRLKQRNGSPSGQRLANKLSKEYCWCSANGGFRGDSCPEYLVNAMFDSFDASLMGVGTLVALSLHWKELPPSIGERLNHSSTQQRCLYGK